MLGRGGGRMGNEVSVDYGADCRSPGFDLVAMPTIRWVERLRHHGIGQQFRRPGADGQHRWSVLVAIMKADLIPAVNHEPKAPAGWPARDLDFGLGVIVGHLSR